MLFFNRTLPLIVAFAFGMLGIVIYYIPHSGAQSVEREMALWVRIVFAFAYLSYVTAELLALSGIISLLVTAIFEKEFAWLNMSM